MTQNNLTELLTPPNTMEDLNIPQNILIDILLRLLYNEGNVNFARIVQVMRVAVVLEKLLELLRQERLIDHSMPDGNFSPYNYLYKLTDAGMKRATEAMVRSQYVGPAPVPVPIYNQVMALQTSGNRNISSGQIKQALSDMILPESFHRQIGPAVNSGTSLFLYGPSGNGKTTIAQKIAGLLAGMSPIWMPYALTAGGQIIQIHDRLFHTPVSAEEKKKYGNIDGRWGLFKRPSVVVGGELKMEALDLRYDPISKIYEAPLQFKANGGMFLIDDFGRQQVSPTDLLNRWIVPLENNIDYLRLRTGQTIVVPFGAFIVFSTNLDPYELADDAFYRRIQMKVGVFSPSEELFRKIFVTMCSQLQMPYDEIAFQHLLENWYRRPGRKLQSVHSRDLLKVVKALCAYENIPNIMTPELMDEACKSYFVDQSV
jgi:predicted ATPase with chaperone activity